MRNLPGIVALVVTALTKTTSKPLLFVAVLILGGLGATLGHKLYSVYGYIPGLISGLFSEEIPALLSFVLLSYLVILTIVAAQFKRIAFQAAVRLHNKHGNTFWPF